MQLRAERSAVTASHLALCWTQHSHLQLQLQQHQPGLPKRLLLERRHRSPSWRGTALGEHLSSSLRAMPRHDRGPRSSATLQENTAFCEYFRYVCPEPVLVK